MISKMKYFLNENLKNKHQNATHGFPCEKFTADERKHI